MRSVESRESEESGNQTTTSPTFSLGTKERAGKDPKKNEDDKKKPLLSDTTAVPVSLTEIPGARPFQLAWPFAKGAAKTEDGSARQSGGAAEDTQDLKSNALKGSMRDSIVQAPVAFGASLSNLNGANSNVKGNSAKSSEVQPKAGAGETTAGKAGEASRLAEGKGSSRNQQGHSDSARDDQPPANSAGVKAGTAAGSAHTESVAAFHAAAPAGNHVPAPLSID